MEKKSAPKKAVKKATPKPRSLVEEEVEEVTNDDILENLKMNLNEIPYDIRTTDLWDERMKLFRTVHGHEVVDALEKSDYFDQWIEG